MWKRLPGRGNRGKENNSLSIGAPALLESTYDQAQLDRARNLYSSEPPQVLLGGEVYHRSDVRPSQARRDHELLKANQLALPSLNFGRHMSPSDTQPGLRPSVAVSSIYSDSDEAVSPPSSPYTRPDNDNGRVSPLDEGHSPILVHDTPYPNGLKQSHIPVARKATPIGASQMAQTIPRTKEWTQNVGKSPMMWDDYSGEPTFDGAGKPSQVKPGEFSNQVASKPVRRGQQLSVPTNHAQAMDITEKNPRLAQRGLAVDTRPPWKGASGRQAIMNTPQDKPGQATPQPHARQEPRFRGQEAQPAYGRASPASPSAQKLAQPPRDNGQVRLSSIHPAYRDREEGAFAHTIPKGQSTYSSSPASTQRYNPMEQSGPITPPSDCNITPSQDYAYPPKMPLGIVRSEDQGDLAYNQKYEPASLAPHAGQHATRQLVQTFADTDAVAARQTSSRFSWTTAATSTTYQHSPPPSPVPPIPTSYQQESSPFPRHPDRSPSGSPSPPSSSVLDRGHPTRRLGLSNNLPSPSGRSFSAGSTLRKPVGTSLAVQSPSEQSAKPDIIQQQFTMGDWRSGIKDKYRAVSLTPTTLSTASQVKSLPKTPQELASADLIATLQAQQNDLQLQRHNLKRVIADLEAPEAKNPLLNSFKMIREGEKRLVNLRLELNEVTRLEHDCGLRLHRAWKRRERDDPNTPASVFWVRRATATD